jgi:hypothetical protein
MKVSIRTSQILAFGGADLEPWADPLFQTLPSGPAVLLSFGAFEYGAQLVDKLRSAGLERLERINRTARVLKASSSSEFNDPSVVAQLEEAGFVYIQGGNPRFIVETLANTLFWDEVFGKRLPLVTTSGSSMALGARCPDILPGRTRWVDGLSAVPDTLIAAHWDSFHVKDPKFRAAFESEAGPRLLYALEDKAALELDGGVRAHGAGAVQVRERGNWSKIP